MKFIKSMFNTLFSSKKYHNLEDNNLTRDKIIDLLKFNGPKVIFAKNWDMILANPVTTNEIECLNILRDINNLLNLAYKNNITFNEFNKNIKNKHLNNIFLIVNDTNIYNNPKDFYVKIVKWSLNILYHSNINIQYAIENWKKINKTKDVLPLWRYTSIIDNRCNPFHAKWHGLILPATHPWWKTHFPPNSASCRCQVFAVGLEDLELYNWKISESLPDDGAKDTVNPLNGKKYTIPNGIDPGWNSTPDAWQEPLNLPFKVPADILVSYLFSLSEFEE